MTRRLALSTFVLMGLAATLVFATTSNAASPTIPSTATISSDIVGSTLQNLIITQGDTITWTNRDAVPHTTTAGQNGAWDGAGWNSPFLNQNQSFNNTFNQAGSFPYTCRVHPGMNATITVQAAPTPSPTGTPAPTSTPDPQSTPGPSPTPAPSGTPRPTVPPQPTATPIPPSTVVPSRRSSHRRSPAATSPWCSRRRALGYPSPRQEWPSRYRHGHARRPSRCGSTVL